MRCFPFWKFLQEFSPRCEGENVEIQGILLGGDQLSTSMARRVIADRINSTNPLQALNGIVPVVEDWHAKLCFLTVSIYMILVYKYTIIIHVHRLLLSFCLTQSQLEKIPIENIT